MRKQALWIALAVVVVVLVSFSAQAQDHAYVGAAKCKMCHKLQYTSWEGLAHAKAFDQLKGDEQSNAECLKCHATGASAEMPGVQCEACHGYGTQHARDGSMRPVPESVCLKCHTPEWTPDWNYAEAVKMIDHGKNGKLD